ncbi:MAG TPA: spore germination protein [Clostridia bacterium]|nr:spore germination protein [Clostridia bacterium]
MGDKFTPDFDANVKLMDSGMRIEESFDLNGRCFKLGNKRAKLYSVNGMVNNDIITEVVKLMLNPENSSNNATDFADRFVAHAQTQIENDVQNAIISVFSGEAVMLIEGYNEAIIIDARHFPVRSVQEPENDRVLRGPHEGFVETIAFNTALIRRRIRDSNLIISVSKIGSRSKTDVALCYLDNKVNKKILNNIEKRMKDININALTMGQESLLECLSTKQKFNPFPRVRFTERPDAAAACVAEGNIIILIDGTPAAMIVPTGIFDFFQDTNDYYFIPMIGTYFKFLRFCISFASVFLIPVWYTFMKYPQYVPEWLDFIRVEDPTGLPIFAQLILVEFIVGALKLASLNTPSVMGATFNIVAALVLGEFAVSARWFVAEVLLYMAFVSMANFAQPNFELAFALKLTRVFYLVSIALFGIWGFLSAIIISTIMLVTTKTLSGQSYLYPLVPFNGAAFIRLIFRRGIHKSNN